MFYGNITNTKFTGGVYNFNQVYLTNNNLSYSNGVITFNKSGWYRVHLDSTMSATTAGDDLTPTLYLNGVQTTTMASETGTLTTDDVNASFETILHIIPTYNNTKETLSIQQTNEATIFDANLVIERIA